MTIPTSIPSPDISSIQVGPFQIHFYALFILTGIVVAVILTSRRLTRRGGEPGIVLDITLWAVPFGIIGGRLYHVVTHPTDYFFPGADLWKTLYVWEGGLAIFGAILFGGLGAYVACRRAGVRFLSFGDALAPGMLLAQSFGRLGNYFNQELFGTPTTLPWGLQITPSQPAFPTGLPADTLFHPLFLYEILWNLAGVIIVLLAERQYNLRWGKTLGLYLIIYGVGRTWFESFRLDPTEFELLGIKINMITATAVAVVGLILIIVQSRRHTEPEPSPYLPGRQWTSLHQPITELPPTAASTDADDVPTGDATGQK
ncbi:prolipoprotein diacylglyceryl transferase [Cryobacterium sp. HLT2-28]|uniref:prolipoprotein diacylglyceryl transferase n=1 Tax=Cryobacterium sp. HLT2-28 TaxID=1259146 RepID=UPI0010696AFF|nr:prolipoprotein diacylglyceryl transferase [Cryobacterium sp. HLT2-28]TFB92569.1 prolipoprotein diacylglyceryl transferase [Cryobacterium sp. HLT2-28]